MQIVLSILQFIGIGLLVLLGVLILLLGLILFYPICYKTEGTFENENRVKANVSWLFHLIRAKFIYEDDLIFAKIGIFWKIIPFSYEFSQRKESSARKEAVNNENSDENVDKTKNKIKRKETDGTSSIVAKETAQESENEFELEIEDLNLDEETDLSENDFNFRNNLKQEVEVDARDLNSDEKMDSKFDTSEDIELEIQDFNVDDDSETIINDNTNAENQSNMDNSNDDTETDLQSQNLNKTEGSSTESDIQEESEPHQNKSEKKSTSKSKRKSKRKKKAKKQKPNVLEKIKGMISKIKGTINKGKEIWREAKAILTDKRNQSAVSHVKNEIFSLLRGFLPKNAKVDIVFSLGSPDFTGKALGLCFVFPFLYQNEWKLRPDFETEEVYVKGKFHANGRIYLYKIVGMVLRILLDKNCRRLYKTGKKFANKIGLGGDKNGRG